MSKLPVVTGRQAMKALEMAGFVCDRTKGSHRIMKKTGHPHSVSVPVHGHTDLKPGTLRGLIRDAGLTVDEFVALLK